jgi:hypothetical protein
MRRKSRTIGLLVLAGCLLASMAAAEPPGSTVSAQYPDAPHDRVRFGFLGTLLGPSSLIGGGLSLQPIKLIEVIAWVGYNKATAESNTSSSQASAKITLIPVLARGRFWFHERHSLLLDLGAGINPTSLSASGSDSTGNSIDYKRSGTPVLTTVGLGYGFRTEGGFRLALLGGALIHVNKLGDSTVSTTGAFSTSDRAAIKADLDDVSNNLTKVRAYIELDLGAVF